MANINKIKLSGQTYDIQDPNASKTVELTQAQYDALVSGGTVDTNTFYIITDAQGADLSQYYTSAQTESAITQAVSGKVDTSTFNTYSGSVDTALASKADTATTYTKTEVDNAITAATSTKQDTLVSGTNIKTINNESLLGSGNITIQGGGTSGGKAIEAGRGISVTTGETADTVSLNEAISASTASSSTYIAIGSGANAVGGYNSFLTNSGGIAIGSGATANRRDICIGNGAKGYNISHSGLICIGLSSVSKQGGISIGNYSEAYGEGGFEQYGGISIGFNSKTQSRNAIAIGYNTVASGTTKTNINNQLTIDTSNQVYISNSANTSTYCLQEKIENTESALGGLKLVKLTQSEYDALTTKDDNTVYFIGDSTNGYTMKIGSANVN